MVHAGLDTRPLVPHGRYSTTDIRRGRPAHLRRRTCLGEEAAEGVLGVDPRLDGVALAAHVVLRQRQRLAGGDDQLQLDQVQPCDGLGDRVLHLQPGVHLQEVELAGGGVEEVLDGPCADVPDLLGQRHRRGGQPGPRPGVDGGRGRLLEHLLVPSLGGAVALPQVQHGAVAVADHLDLEVAPGLDVLLDQHGVVAERARRLPARGGDRLGELRRGPADPHALAAAAGGRLDQDRVVEGRRILVEGVRRHDRHARRDGDLAGRVLAAHLLHHRGAGPGQGDALVLERGREGRPLGEEAVAGVHDVGARAQGGVDHGPDVEVRRHAHRRVGRAHVRRGRVEVGVDGDGAHAHRLRGAEDAQGDLTAVRHQYGSHVAHILKTP